MSTSAAWTCHTAMPCKLRRTCHQCLLHLGTGGRDVDNITCELRRTCYQRLLHLRPEGRDVDNITCELRRTCNQCPLHLRTEGRDVDNITCELRRTCNQRLLHLREPSEQISKFLLLITVFWKLDANIKCNPATLSFLYIFSILTLKKVTMRYTIPWHYLMHF